MLPSDGQRAIFTEETMRNIMHLSAFILLCVICGQQAQAQPEPYLGGAERCAGLSVDVSAGSQDERRLVCSAARHALQRLGRCGIALRRALHVEILSEVRHPFSGPIFGLFDIVRERVLVTQEANISGLVENTPYANLPERAFYLSLIGHEVVHGIMHQNLKRKATTHAAYEYPAYALQIESLPSDVREAFLRSFDLAALKSNTMFNDSVLFFDPYYFAARAYHHFTSAPDACKYLAGLLADEADFIAPPM